MGLSIWHIIVVAVVVVLLFGAGKIPRLMGDVAKGIKSFKAGLKDDSEDGADAPAQITRTDSPAAGSATQQAQDKSKSSKP